MKPVQNETVYVVVQDSVDMSLINSHGIAMCAIRGIYRSHNEAHDFVQHCWDVGERPQCRVVPYQILPIRPEIGKF